MIKDSWELILPFRKMKDSYLVQNYEKLKVYNAKYKRFSHRFFTKIDNYHPISSLPQN